MQSNDIEYGIFEDIPKGKENAIPAWRLARQLQYPYQVSSYLEIRRILDQMTADGYVVMHNEGNHYRAANVEEVIEYFGNSLGYGSDDSPWKF